MRRALISCSLFLLLAPVAAAPAPGQEQAPAGEENFYAKSLHYTSRGIEFLYSKERGGVERITGVSAEKLGCLKARCHVRTCDTCHVKETNGKASYSLEAARAEAACRRCHPVAEGDPDVHFRSGMKCMKCHSAREIHGDGVAYNTYMEPGVLDTRCETCHSAISRSASHTIHGGKLDCSTCHTLEFQTCLNCHYDTRLAGGKDVQIERRGMFFLVNHDGKITLANFMTHVYGNRTMITLAPYFPHSITKRGRTCDACHGTSIVREVKDGSFVPFMWKDGDLESVEGVIPVVEGMKWNVVFLGREEDRWVPLGKPEPPLINFAGYSAPLTRDQLGKLESPQRAR